MRSKALRSTTKSLMIGNARARQGSIHSSAPSGKCRRCSWHRDRLFLARDELLVHHVEQLQERHVGARNSPRRAEKAASLRSVRLIGPLCPRTLGRPAPQAEAIHITEGYVTSGRGPLERCAPARSTTARLKSRDNRDNIATRRCTMARSVPDEIAARLRRLPAAQQRQALAYVEVLERAAQGAALTAFAGSIPPDELAAMAAAIEAGCERVDAADW